MKFSNARRVLSLCNTRLRLLYLLNNQRHVGPTTRRLRLVRLRSAVPATGLLVFRAVAEPRFEVNPRNPAKFTETAKYRENH